MPLALGAASSAFVLLAAVIVMIALVLAAAYAYATPRPDRLPITRVADPQLSIGVGNHVALRVRNPFVRPLRALLVDGVPASFDVDLRRLAVEVAARDEAEVRYVTRPRHRGSFRFGDVQLRLRGPLDLIEKQGHVAATAAANVYPDLHEVRR
ncbi:MAG: hypothetical protein AAB295_01480, partial [Chloroflexota bacterium]